MLQWLPFFAHHSACPFSSSLENMSAPGSEGAARYGGDVLSAGSPDRFGYEWHNYPELRSEYEEQFRDWTAHLQPEDWCGLTFLDVGCGMGRNSYWPMVYGAAGGLAVGLAHHLARSPTVMRWLLLRVGFGSIAYFRLLRRFSLRHCRSIVFDQMLPKIAHYWPRTMIEGLMREQGLLDVRLIWVNEVSWSAVGTKPVGRDTMSG